MKINDYSFKYACAVCCLKILFYCLTFSAMSNINSGDFTTPNSQSLIFEIEMLLKFQNKTNIEMMGLNPFWIHLRIVKCRFVKYRFFRCTFRFVRYIYTQ